MSTVDRIVELADELIESNGIHCDHEQLLEDISEVLIREFGTRDPVYDAGLRYIALLRLRKATGLDISPP